MTDLTALTPISTPLVTDVAYTVNDPTGAKNPRQVTWGNVANVFRTIVEVLTGKTISADLNSIIQDTPATGEFLRDNGTKFVPAVPVASDISDFDTEVANNSAVTANTSKISYTDAAAVTANTAKVTNATHTGDVTGATALTLAAVKDVNGLQEDVIYAGSMINADGTTNATAEFTTRYAATNLAPVQSYNFDTTADEYCYFDWRPVKQWNAGTVKVKAVWNNIAGLTTETIELEVSAVAFSDTDAETTAFGTAQNITDTWSAQNTYQESAYSNAITIANTPAKGDLVKFQVMRDVSADNLTGDLELCKIIIQYTIDAATSV